MATLNDLLEKINFTPDEVKVVNDALENLLATINSKAQEGKIPKPIVFNKYGSISRKTKIKPLDDIDIFYVVGRAQSQYNNSHLITECSYPFTAEDHEPVSNISSIFLLNKIKGAIKKTYSRSDVKKNKEVVNVYLDTYEVGFDIAPVFEITNENYYLIASPESPHLWKRTNPFIGNDFIEKVNIKTGGNLINTIKILKYWFQKKKIVSPTSYHLECVLANIFNVYQSNLYFLKDALQLAYGNLDYDNNLRECIDPFNSSKTLTSNLTTEDIEKIITEAQYAFDLLLNRGISEFVEYIDPEIE